MFLKFSSNKIQKCNNLLTDSGAYTSYSYSGSDSDFDSYSTHYTNENYKWKMYTEYRI